MKTIGNVRKLLLLLCLIVAGAQSAWALPTIWFYFAEVKTLTIGNVTYELCHTYDQLQEVYRYDLETGTTSYRPYSGSTWPLKINEQYYASVVGVTLTSNGSIEIRDNITDGGQTYPVKYVGLHTEQVYNDMEVYLEWTEFKDNPNSSWGFDVIEHKQNVPIQQKKRSTSLREINNQYITSLTTKSYVEFMGKFVASGCQSATFEMGVIISSDVFLTNATQVTFGGMVVKISKNGYLEVHSLRELRFPSLVHEGQIAGRSLTDIYFDNISNLPAYSGSAYNYFPQGVSYITCHMPDGTTASRIQQLKSTAVFAQFKDIVAGVPKVNYTLVSGGTSDLSLFKLPDGSSSYSNTGPMTLVNKVVTGSRTGTVEVGKNYAVVIGSFDASYKNVKLTRNGVEVPLQEIYNEGLSTYYYDERNLKNDVNYEFSTTDKTCTLKIVQEGYRGNIVYTKTVDGVTSTGLLYNDDDEIVCAQGKQVKLSIPYDQNKPLSLRVNNGSPKELTYENGRATISFYTLLTESTTATLTWQEPEPIVVVVPDPEEPGQTIEEEPHHQPKIMVMRSGEGDVLLKGMCIPNDQQSIDRYEQEFDCTADENGWVMNAVANCTDAVTTLTVPDVDYLGLGGYLSEGSWGFQMEIKPVAGQGIKSLMVGYINKWDDEQHPYVEWEDFKGTGYLTFDQGTGIYTFQLMGAYMEGYVAGDYIVNLALGPEETAVETGKTLNFVRKGGRGLSWIYWDDQNQDFFFEEGSSSTTIPNEQLSDLEMHIEVMEGEAIHVYKNGVDITEQFQLPANSNEYRTNLEEESATYTLLIDDAPNANPTWTIHNETEGDVIVVSTLKDGTTETTTFTGNINDLDIDDSQVNMVTLRVYAENQNGSKPVRVLKNGQDVSYQFTVMDPDGDLLYLCYEVPVSMLTNCNWDISYDTSRAQTFVVKGGNREQLVEVEHELLYGAPTLHVARNDGPKTIYLPPYNQEYNGYINMSVYAEAGEGVTIKRNGIDVTYYFTETAEGSSGKCYSLEISESDLSDNSTVGLLSFELRDPAVWEIVYKSIEEQKKALRVSNTDQMEIVYERNYTNGTTVPEYFKNPETGEIAKYVERFFDDSDRENTRFIYLHVPIPESQPIRVLCNGEDVTYSKHDEWINEDWVTYIVSMTQDQTWNISYDTSHKQTFIVKGGLYPEVNYEYKAGDITKDVQVGGITEVCLPDYNPDYDNTYAYFTIGTLPNESFTALRNGVDVTDKFTKEVVSDNLWRYTFNFDNSDVAAALGVDLRDPAVWQITIGDESSDDDNAVEYLFIGDFNKVYASADYNNDVTYEGYQFMQENVVGYYAGKVVENGQAANSEGAVEFWMPNANDTFRVYRNYQDMTNQFVPNGSGGWIWANNDGLIHAPAHWIIINENTTKLYDVNHDGKIDIADVTALVNKVLDE